MAEFTLYTFTFPSRAERVLWCLNELELDYQLKKLDPFKGELFSEEFAQLSPMRKMPVLIHHCPHNQDKVLIESLAINEYLNNYAKGSLKPKNLDDLYQYDRSMYFGVTELEAYMWVANQSTILRGIYHWPLNTEKEAIRQVRRALPEVFEWLEKTNYIAGNEFSLADIFYFQLLNWAMVYENNTPAHVQRYINRLKQRPAIPD